MLLVIPLILWVGLSIVIYSGILVSLFKKTMTNYPDWSSNEKTQNAMFTMTMFGVGEIIGALSCG